MNIIVKDVDDFISCFDCPCYDHMHDMCHVTKRKWKDYRRFSEKNKCPIVKLKENRHYIDANRLIAVLSNTVDVVQTDIDLFEHIIELIKHQPDILAERENKQ